MNSLSITVIGIIIVFIALFLIEYAIRLFSKILTIRIKPSRSETAEQEPVEVSSSYDESRNETDSESGIASEQEIAAVIAAAIQAAFSNREVKSNLRVRSFRRVSVETPVWKSAAWYQQMQARGPATNNRQ